MLLFTARTTLLRACSKMPTTRSNNARSTGAGACWCRAFCVPSLGVDFLFAVILDWAVDLIAKTAKIAKKDSYEWMAYVFPSSGG